MSTKEVRRQNLQLILSSLGGHGAQKILSEKSGIHHTYISNIRLGNREMGEEIARKIEATMGLTVGWMDQIHSTIADESAAYVKQATPDEVVMEARLLALWEQLSASRQRLALELLADMVAAEQGRLRSSTPPVRR